MHSDITGVILAGGKSSRMGVNKSFLKLGNQTIIERLVDLMKSIFSEIIIITNTPDEYKFLNIPLYEDIYKWKGPLAGIHSALIHSKSERIFVLACDLPFVSKEMIEYILDYPTAKPVVFCQAGGFHQPLVGIYSKSILPNVENFLSSNDFSDKSFHTFLKTIDVEIIHPENLPFYKEELFFNLNTTEDYLKLIDLWQTFTF
jgi:molybdopterin-guanine dinucleotide biosynthesis protein A